jgi:hypothetical protein
VNSVNQFSFVPQFEIWEGDSVDLYLQLSDVSVEPYLVPTGRRWIAPDTSTLTVSIVYINSDTNADIAATQPFDTDPSIWKISLTAVQAIAGTHGLKLLVSTPIVGAVAPAPLFTTLHGWSDQALVVHALTQEF